MKVRGIFWVLVAMLALSCRESRVALPNPGTAVSPGLAERAAALNSLTGAEVIAYLGNDGFLGMTDEARHPSVLYRLTDAKLKNDNGVIGSMDDLLFEIEDLGINISNLQEADNDFVLINEESQAATGYTFLERLAVLRERLASIEACVGAPGTTGTSGINSSKLPDIQLALAEVSADVQAVQNQTNQALGLPACLSDAGCVGMVSIEACQPYTGTCNATTGLCERETLPDGYECRPAAGSCDAAEACAGGVCPNDSFEPTTTVCRAAASDCDVAETCTGSGPHCPQDGFAAADTPCRPAQSDCDVEETCTGSGPLCPQDGFATAGALCRAAAGDCDVEETCSGSSAECPYDLKSTALCRLPAGDCDQAESCDGLDDQCPEDLFQPPATVCRGAVAGGCDVAETCSGSGTQCPPDGYADAGTDCRAAGGACEEDATCTGASATCPTNVLKIAGTVCRAASGECEEDATCTGNSTTCPPNPESPQYPRLIAGGISAGGWSPHFATDGAGTAFAVWSQWAGSRHDVWASRYVSGTGWGPPQLIETDDAGSAIRPQVAVDSAGNAFVVWQQSDGTRDNIWANRYQAGSGWGVATKIETDDTGPAHFPRIATDSAGNAISVWYQNIGTDYCGYRIWANRYEPLTGWGTAGIIQSGDTLGEHVDLAMRPNGNALAVWLQTRNACTNVEVWASHFVPGVGWGTPEMVSDQGSVETAPSVGIDASGNAIAVWSRGDGIWAGRYIEGTGWGTPVRIQLENGSARDPRLSVDGNGAAIALWDEFDGTDRNIWAARFEPTGGWSTAAPIETTAGNAISPQIAMDPGGNVFAVWAQANGSTHPDIWANRFVVGSGWGTATTIETDTVAAGSPQVAFDGNGDALVVWSQAGIRWNRYTSAGWRTGECTP